jgi:hypothetical protein
MAVFNYTCKSNTIREWLVTETRAAIPGRDAGNLYSHHPHHVQNDSDTHADSCTTGIQLIL